MTPVGSCPRALQDDALFDRCAIEEGSRFIRKPFEPDALVRAIRQALEG